MAHDAQQTQSGKNTRISLRYTSEAGTEHLDVVFRGAITDEQWSQLLDAANSNVMEGFIPAQVGLPAPYDQRMVEYGPDETDHVSTLFADESLPASALWTTEPATDERDIADFVKIFKSRTWDIGQEMERCQKASSPTLVQLHSSVTSQEAESPYRVSLVGPDGALLSDSGNLLKDIHVGAATNLLSRHLAARYQSTREVSVLRLNTDGEYGIKRAEPGDALYSPASIKQMLGNGEAWLLLSLQDGANALHELSGISHEFSKPVGAELVSVSLPWDLKLDGDFKSLPQPVVFSESDASTTVQVAAILAIAKVLQVYETYDPKVFSGNHFLLPEERVNAMIGMVKETPAAQTLLAFEGAALRDELGDLQKQMPMLNSSVDLLKASASIVKKTTGMIDALRQNSLKYVKESALEQSEPATSSLKPR